MLFTCLLQSVWKARSKCKDQDHEQNNKTKTRIGPRWQFVKLQDQKVWILSVKTPLNNTWNNTLAKAIDFEVNSVKNGNLKMGTTWALQSICNLVYIPVHIFRPSLMSAGHSQTTSLTGMNRSFFSIPEQLAGYTVAESSVLNRQNISTFILHIWCNHNHTNCCIRLKFCILFFVYFLVAAMPSEYVNYCTAILFSCVQ